MRNWKWCVCVYIIDLYMILHSYVLMCRLTCHMRAQNNWKVKVVNALIVQGNTGMCSLLAQTE